MKKRILLINPIKKEELLYSFTTPPLGLTSIMTAINRSAGYDVEIFDMQHKDNTESVLLDKVSKNNFDIIGYSINSYQYWYTKNLNNSISRLTNAISIAGGPHATAKPAMLLGDGFKYVIRGEGEYTITELLNSLDSSTDLSKIKGLAYLNNNQVVMTPQRDRETNLDKFGMLDFKSLNLDKYSQFATMSSRGCPYSCSFCASKVLWNDKVTFRSLDTVVNEISTAVRDYNFHEGVIVDDNLNMNSQRFNKFCEMLIKENLDFSWSMNSRVDSAKKTNFGLAKKAGCKIVSYGFESGSQVILDQIEKDIKVEDMYSAVSIPRSLGIKVKTNWIVGLPGTYDEQLKSIKVMQETQPDTISVHIFVPFPGTYYSNNPSLFGLHYDEKELLAKYNYNTYPIPIKYDYLSHDQIISILSEMTEAMLSLGYKTTNNAKAGDKIIHTPLLYYPKRGQI